MTRTGAAYIITDDLDSDVYIAPKHINGALNGDTVSILLFPAIQNVVEVNPCASLRVKYCK